MKSSNIISFLSIIYLLHSVPALGFRYPSSIYALLVIVLFTILTYKTGIKNLLSIIPIFFIPILDIIISLDNLSLVSVLRQTSLLLQNLILPLLYIYIYKYNKIKLGKSLIIVYIVIILTTCITTYLGYRIYPTASRELATGEISQSPLYYIYLSYNIGGFSFIYNLLLLSILLICTIKNPSIFKRNRIVTLLCIASLIIIGLVILKSQYTTAILLFFVSLVLLVLHSKFKIKYIFTVVSIGIFIVFMLREPLSSKLMLISENIESYDVSQRIYDISQYIIGEHTSDNSDLDAREDLYKKSVETFSNNILGTWNNKNIGGHSFILDNMAKYGILGIIMIIIMIYKLYKLYISQIKNDRIIGYAYYLLLIYIILAIVNPHIFTDIIMFVLPLYYFINISKSSKTVIT